MATTPTRTTIYTAMRFSSDAPRSPALWALRTLLTGEAKPALDRRRVAAPSSTQPASPPPGGTSPNQCGNAGLHRRTHASTAPPPPATPPCARQAARKPGRRARLELSWPK